MKLLFPVFLVLLVLAGCEGRPGQFSARGYAGMVFESDPREKDAAFVPTHADIEKAEQRLLEYLADRTKNGSTMYVNLPDEKVPLENRLAFYKEGTSGGSIRKMKR